MSTTASPFRPIGPTFRLAVTDSASAALSLPTPNASADIINYRVVYAGTLSVAIVFGDAGVQAPTFPAAAGSQPVIVMAAGVTEVFAAPRNAYIRAIGFTGAAGDLYILPGNGA